MKKEKDVGYVYYGHIHFVLEWLGFEKLGWKWAKWLVANSKRYGWKIYRLIKFYD